MAVALRMVKGGKNMAKQQDKTRLALLAKIHIAKKELGLTDDEYEEHLNADGVKQATVEGWIMSARALSNAELAALVERFKLYGWKVKPPSRPIEARRAEALRHRINRLAAGLDNGFRRLDGICKKCTGVHRLSWIHNEKELIRILAAIEGISRRERRDG